MKCNRVQLTQTPKRNKNDLGKQGSELLGLKLNFNYPVFFFCTSHVNIVLHHYEKYSDCILIIFVMVNSVLLVVTKWFDLIN